MSPHLNRAIHAGTDVGPHVNPLQLLRRHSRTHRDLAQGCDVDPCPHLDREVDAADRGTHLNRARRCSADISPQADCLDSRPGNLRPHPDRLRKPRRDSATHVNPLNHAVGDVSTETDCARRGRSDISPHRHADDMAREELRVQLPDEDGPIVGHGAQGIGETSTLVGNTSRGGIGHHLASHISDVDMGEQIGAHLQCLEDLRRDSGAPGESARDRISHRGSHLERLRCDVLDVRPHLDPGIAPERPNGEIVKDLQAVRIGDDPVVRLGLVGGVDALMDKDVVDEELEGGPDQMDAEADETALAKEAIDIDGGDGRASAGTDAHNLEAPHAARDRQARNPLVTGGESPVGAEDDACRPEAADLQAALDQEGVGLVGLEDGTTECLGAGDGVGLLFGDTIGKGTTGLN